MSIHTVSGLHVHVHVKIVHVNIHVHVGIVHVNIQVHVRIIHLQVLGVHVPTIYNSGTLW